MFRKLATVAPWALLIFIAGATLSPIQYRPKLFPSGNIEHVTAFAMLGLLLVFAYPRQVVQVCLIVLGGALLLELAQLLTPDRHGQIQDAFDKAEGGAIGVAAGRLILHLARSHWPQDRSKIRSDQTRAPCICEGPQSFGADHEHAKTKPARESSV
jgi:hypothetical protein